MKIGLSLTSLLFFFLAGCAASGPKFSEPEAFVEEKAIVYMYRPYVLFRGGETPTIFVDDIATSQLSNGGYIFFHTAPGTHKVRIGKKTAFTLWSGGDLDGVIDVVSNKRYYLRLDINFEGVLPFGSMVTYFGSTRLVEIPETIAIEELRELNSSM